MKRTFIAVKIDAAESFKEMVLKLRVELKDDSIKWVDTENMHVTIAFLGDTDDNAVKQTGDMLKERCRDTGSFTFALSGLGVFRNTDDPRVLWAGIDKNRELVNLHATVKEGLEAAGIRTEERSFNPHLTIGRIKRISDKRNLEALLKRYDKVWLQDVTVSEVIHYESILRQTGPEYKPLSVIRL